MEAHSSPTDSGSSRALRYRKQLSRKGWSEVIPKQWPSRPRVSYEADSLVAGLGPKSFQFPSETTSTVPSTT